MIATLFQLKCFRSDSKLGVSLVSMANVRMKVGYSCLYDTSGLLHIYRKGNGGDSKLVCGGGGGGGISRKIGGGVSGTLPETLTKICDFPYPISDLIKNLIPFFRPDPYSATTSTKATQENFLQTSQ